MQRFIIAITLLLAPYIFSSQTISGQTNTTINESLKFSTAVSKLTDYYSEVIGYYLNRPLYVGDFNIHNLKQDINTAIYAIDPKSPAEKENNAQQEYLSAKYDTSNFFEKEELVSLITQAEITTESVKKECINLSNYFSNKEYMNDPSFSEYLTLRDNLQKKTSLAQEAWKKVTTYNSDVKDAAETQILQSKKIAEFVVPMKEDLDKLRKIVSQVYSQDFSLIILKLDIEDLQSNINIHQDPSKKNSSKLKDESYVSIYKRFYSSSQQCLETALKILNCVEQKKYDKELDLLFDKLNETFNKVEEDYKLFASQE